MRKMKIGRLRSVFSLYGKIKESEIKDKVKFIWDEQKGLGAIQDIQINPKRSRAEVYIKTKDFEKRYSLPFYKGQGETYLSKGDSFSVLVGGY